MSDPRHMKWISDQGVGLMSIHQFLLGEMRNPDRLSIFHFAVFTHEELESTHDFFQWVFPLNQPSKNVPSSPVLTDAEVLEIQKDSEVTIMMAKQASIYLNLLKQNRDWVCDHHHTHLRITRAIKSLSLLVNEGFAERFRKNVLKLLGDDVSKISRATLEYWDKA